MTTPQLYLLKDHPNVKLIVFSTTMAVGALKQMTVGQVGYIHIQSLMCANCIAEWRQRLRPSVQAA